MKKPAVYLVIIISLAGFSCFSAPASEQVHVQTSQSPNESKQMDLDEADNDKILQDFPGEGELFANESYVDEFLGFKIDKFPDRHTYKGGEDGDDYILKIYNGNGGQVGLITISPWSAVDSLALDQGDVDINGTPARKNTVQAPEWNSRARFNYYEMESIENDTIVRAYIVDDLASWFESNWYFLQQGSVTADKSDSSLADKSYDIVDLYLMLPDNYFLCDSVLNQVTTDYKMDIIEEEDPDNGYLKADPGYPLEVMELDSSDAYFRVVILTDCGEACMCNTLDVKTLTAVGVWEDSNSLLPINDINKIEDDYVAGEDAYLFKEFDPFGKSVQIFDDNTGQLVYQLKWEADEFIVVND